MDRTDTVPLDSIARALASGLDRRRLLRAVGLGLAGAIAGRHAASAQNDRDSTGPSVDQTITGVRGSDEPIIRIDKYCPPGTTHICLEPTPGGSTDPADLCTCKCSNDMHFDGKTCSCPPGTGCSGYAAAGRKTGPDSFHDREYTTEGTCCSYPQVAFACSNSGPGMKDGFAVCCTPGVDCPFGYDEVNGLKAPAGVVCAVANRLPCCDYSCGKLYDAIAGATDY